MRYYRLTKYDPNLRNEGGRYTIIDEWTEFGDVWKAFDWKVLTMGEYVRFEDEMIRILSKTVDSLWLRCLKFTDLETGSDVELHRKLIRDPYIRNPDDFIRVVRSVFRYGVWWKISAKGFFIHFGYDGYVFVGIGDLRPAVLDDVRSDIIYIEDFRSPYVRSKD